MTCWQSLTVMTLVLNGGQPAGRAAAVGVAQSNLPSAEMQRVYKAAGLTVRGTEVLDACMQPVRPHVDVIDLNADGVPEVFILVDDSLCYGMAGSDLSLLIKDKQGRWRRNLGVSAGGYKLLRTRKYGYPDIEILGPGTCMPVWRWSGTTYGSYRVCEH